MTSHRRGLSPEARLSMTKTLAAIRDDEDEDLELDFNELFDGANHKHRDDEGEKADQNGVEERSNSELSASERGNSEVTSSTSRFLGAASLKERGHSFVGPTPSFEKPGLLAELRGLRFAEETMGNADVLDALQELQEAGAEAVEEDDGDDSAGAEPSPRVRPLSTRMQSPSIPIGDAPNESSGIRLSLTQGQGLSYAGALKHEPAEAPAHAAQAREADGHAGAPSDAPLGRSPQSALERRAGHGDDGVAVTSCDASHGGKGGEATGAATAAADLPAAGPCDGDGSKDGAAVPQCPAPCADGVDAAGPPCSDGTGPLNQGIGDGAPAPGAASSCNAGDGTAVPTSTGHQGLHGAPRRKLSTDDFELLRVVGQGAFGKVFAVVDRTNQQVYAMKVMRKDRILERRQTSYMRTERDILKAVRHPYIVTLRYSFQSPSKLYLVLDFINGGHLFFQLYQQGTFSEELARFYLAEIVLAVHHLHSLDIIHRDLKPENILLDHEGHVKITDFGLAKPQMAEGRATNSMAGTVEYMAPEIVLGKGHSKPADWWSVGILLFEMLTGSTPFSTKDRSKLQARIVKDKVKLPPFLSPKVASLLKGLLNKDAAKRLSGEEILKHPFFAGIKWAQVESRQWAPPYRPAVESERCFRNFDETYTKQLARDSPCDAAHLANPLHHDDFMGFSYEYGTVGKTGSSLAAMEHALHVSGGRAVPLMAADVVTGGAPATQSAGVMAEPAAVVTDATHVVGEPVVKAVADAAVEPLAAVMAAEPAGVGVGPDAGTMASSASIEPVGAEVVREVTATAALAAQEPVLAAEAVVA